MGTTQPIRNLQDIQRMKNYFLEKGQIRNYTMITLALNTSLRISDLLHLKWSNVYWFEREEFREHIRIVEQKTHKSTQIFINQEARHALSLLKNAKKGGIGEDDYIFKSRSGGNRPISRSRAFVIVKGAADDLGFEGIIGCHSLRKTFGYQAWKTGVPPALIMSIYNHSSIEITKRYLAIEQDDKDDVFSKLNL